MGRKAIPEEDRRKTVGFSVSPETPLILNEIMLATDDRSVGATIDRLAREEQKRIARRKKADG
jgi:hypothetical protein